MPTDVPDAGLSDDQIYGIAAHLPEFIDRERFTSDVRHVAADYLRALDQPAPSRSEASYQLHLIAHLTWKMLQTGATLDRGGEIRDLMNGLNTFAAACWLASAGDDPAAMLPPDPHEPIDLDRVGNVAAKAWRLGFGGDYANASLICAIDQLIDVFKAATGEKVTFGRATIGAVNHRGNATRVTGSACGKMMLSFFAAVDPALGARAISNAFLAFCRPNEG